MAKEGWERASDEGRPWTDAEAARAVAACNASGMRIADFARMHRMTPAKLYWWRKKLARPGASAGLLPVRMVSGQDGTVGEHGPRVVLTDGRLRLEVDGMSPEWVAALMRLMRGSEG